MEKVIKKKANSIKALKHVVKRMYVEQGMSVPEICRELNLNPKSVYNYVNKNDGEWNKERDQINKRSVKTPELLTSALEGIIEKVDSLMSSDAPPQELAESLAKMSDSISKITKTIKGLYKDHDRLESTLVAISDLNTFIKTEGIIDPAFYSQFASLMEKFKTFIINKYAK